MNKSFEKASNIYREVMEKLAYQGGDMLWKKL